MQDETLSKIITFTALAIFMASAWATFWIWRARRSGWTRLAAAYAAPAKPEATARRWQSIKFLPAKVRYWRLLTVRLSIDGMWIVPNALCRFGHMPLLIPWDDIEIQAVETYPADRLYDLRVKHEPNVRMRVGVTVAQYIRRAADNSRYFATPARPVRASVTTTLPLAQKTTSAESAVAASSV